MTTINNLNQVYQTNYDVNNSVSKISDNLSFSSQQIPEQSNGKVSTVTQEDLKKMESDLTIKYLKMSYVKDKETGENVIQIKDNNNNLIRQIPRKEQLVIRKAIDDFLKKYDSKGNATNISTGLLSVQS